MKLSTKKNPNLALALNAEKPRQRKARSAVCIQSPQALEQLLLEFGPRKASSRVPTHDQFTQEHTTFECLNVWGREKERMKQKGEIRASIRERGPPWSVS